MNGAIGGMDSRCVVSPCSQMTLKLTSEAATMRSVEYAFRSRW
jgi:hypothetical protein